MRPHDFGCCQSGHNATAFPISFFLYFCSPMPKGRKRTADTPAAPAQTGKQLKRAKKGSKEQENASLPPHLLQAAGTDTSLKLPLSLLWHANNCEKLELLIQELSKVDNCKVLLGKKNKSDVSTANVVPIICQTHENLTHRTRLRSPRQDFSEGLGLLSGQNMQV
jgi:hypothetical protein